MSETFSAGDRVRVKDAEKIKELHDKSLIACWWNENMYQLCGKEFTITSTHNIPTPRGVAQHITWFNTKWDISSDMIEHVPKMEDIYRTATWYQYPEYRSLHERMADEKRMEEAVRDWAGIEKRPESRIFATYDGPCAPDSMIDSMKYRAMVDWSAIMRIEPGQVVPGSEKSKSRLSFSKIK